MSDFYLGVAPSNLSIYTIWVQEASYSITKQSRTRAPILLTARPTMTAGITTEPPLAAAVSECRAQTGDT